MGREGGRERGRLLGLGVWRALKFCSISNTSDMQRIRAEDGINLLARKPWKQPKGCCTQKSPYLAPNNLDDKAQIIPFTV